jgi:heptosyltransferase III
MNEPGTSSYGRGNLRGRTGWVRILVICPGAIGDVLLTFPVLKALREYYTNAHTTLVSNAQVLPLALASGVAEEVSDYQDKQWGELFSTTGIRTPALASLLDCTDLAICWIRDTDGIVERNLSAAGVKRLIIAPGRPSQGTHIHIVDYLAQTVGLPPVSPRFVPLSWNTGAASEDTRKQYVAIHPGSGGAQKCWPASHFASVIERLWQQNRPVLLLEGPADTEQVRNLLNLVSSPPVPEMLKVLTNAPILEVARQLQQCRSYLGNDSGITHLAAILGIPTVAIFGPSDPTVWRPLGPSVKVIQEQALEDVPVDMVMEAVNVFSE